jgi:hypothetical protein
VHRDSYEQREKIRARGGTDMMQSPIRYYQPPYKTKTEEELENDKQKPAYLPPGVSREDNGYLLKEPTDNLRERDIATIRAYRKNLGMNPDRTTIPFKKNEDKHAIKEALDKRSKLISAEQENELRNNMIQRSAIYDTSCYKEELFIVDVIFTQD